MKAFVVAFTLIVAFIAVRFSGGPVLAGASWQHIVTDCVALWCFGVAVGRVSDWVTSCR